MLTHRQMESSEKIRFTDRNAKELIDRYEITVVPTLLGSGIRLFGHGEKEIKLKLIRTRSYQGMTDLIYERRAEKKIG